MKGQKLRITLNGKFVAFANECTVHVTKNLEASSTKDTTDDFETQEVVGKSWDISASALYSVVTDADAVNGVDALDLALADATVTVVFKPVDGTKNRVDAAGYAYTGTAIVNDISLNAPNRQNATYQIQLTGSGPLTKSEQQAQSDISH